MTPNLNEAEILVEEQVRTADQIRKQGGFIPGIRPGPPTATYSGTPGYPANGLAFTSSAFDDPQGKGTFGAMEWRLAEYRPNAIQPEDEPALPAKSVWK